MGLNQFSASVGLVAVSALSISLMDLAWAGPGSTGGGFYGRHDGQWVLLDDLEEGIVFKPEKETSFSEINQILVQLDSIVPEFSADLRESLVAKTWHKVPFELRCEDPKTPLMVEVSVGACQDATDIYLNERKLADDPAGLMLHEMIQSVRLKFNRDRSSEHALPPAAVRKLKRVLTRPQELSEDSLMPVLSSLGFKYVSLSSQRRTEALMSEVEAMARQLRERYEGRVIFSREAKGIAIDFDALFIRLSRSPGGVEAFQPILKELLGNAERAIQSRSFDSMLMVSKSLNRFIESSYGEPQAGVERLDDLAAQVAKLLVSGVPERP